MNTILTDDEIKNAIAPLYAGEEVLELALIVELDTARAVEAAVLTKLAQQEPIYAFRRRGLNDYCTCTKELYDEVSAKPHFFEVSVFYPHPAPQQADRQRVPDGYVLVPRVLLERASASIGSFVSDQGWGQADMDAMDGIDAMLAASTEAPAQASAVDERDRKDAERYRWLREQHWTENLIGVVIRPKDNAKLGSMLPSLELLDDTIDRMKARAALAKNGGAA